MENAYKQMVKNQEDLESRLSIIIKRRDQINPEIINFQTELESLKEQLKNMKLGFIGSIFTSEDEKRKRKNEVDSLNRKINSVQKN
jgi:predicted  nucleic acid-binding Zn-ribbon protein